MEINEIELKVTITAAKAGKQSAFNVLLDAYWNFVYGYQLKRVQNEHEAEDITIEAFAKAFDKIEGFNEDYVFSTWLITISKNIQIDKYRKQKQSVIVASTKDKELQMYNVADQTPTQEDALITEQNLVELLALMKMLKPIYREVLNLRYFQEMSYQDIADQLDEPLTNVKVRLLRAKKLLAESINNHHNR